MPVLRRAVPAVTKTLPGSTTQGRSKESSRIRPAKGRSRASRASSWSQAMSSLCSSSRLPSFEFAAQGRDGTSGFFLEVLDQLVLALRQEGFQRGERDFRFLAAGAADAEHHFVGTEGGVVEQALVNVADLFHAQRPEGHPSGFRRRCQRRLLCAGVAGS